MNNRIRRHQLNATQRNAAGTRDTTCRDGGGESRRLHTRCVWLDTFALTPVAVRIALCMRLLCELYYGGISHVRWRRCGRIAKVPGTLAKCSKPERVVNNRDNNITEAEAGGHVWGRCRDGSFAATPNNCVTNRCAARLIAVGQSGTTTSVAIFSDWVCRKNRIFRILYSSRCSRCLLWYIRIHYYDIFKVKLYFGFHNLRRLYKNVDFVEHEAL